jgi:hypothetical protein
LKNSKSSPGLTAAALAGIETKGPAERAAPVRAGLFEFFNKFLVQRQLLHAPIADLAHQKIMLAAATDRVYRPEFFR